MIKKINETNGRDDAFVSVSYDFSWEDLQNIVWEDENVEPHSPERMLFIAVFIQALLDATKPSYEGEPNVSKKNRRRSHKWFSLPGCVTASTFEPICDLAGINPEYARKHYEKIQAGEIEFPHRRINVLLNSSKE